MVDLDDQVTNTENQSKKAAKKLAKDAAKLAKVFQTLGTLMKL